MLRPLLSDYVYLRMMNCMYAFCLFFAYNSVAPVGSFEAKQIAAIHSMMVANTTLPSNNGALFRAQSSNVLSTENSNGAISGIARRQAPIATCETISSLPFCIVLIGAQMSSTSTTRSTSDQAYQLDSAVYGYYTLATSRSGWTVGGKTFKVSPSKGCRQAFSSYFCLNPQILATAGLTFNCEPAKNLYHVPCLQRCIDFQIVCLGINISGATTACNASSPSLNTATNSNCYCGDNFLYGSSPYDECSGPCDVKSECGTCPTIANVNFCDVLIGSNLAATSINTVALAQALALDSFVATGYSNASSTVGWNFLGQNILVIPSPACTMAFASYFCMNPIIISNFSLSGTCGMPANIPFVTCLERCVDYQISCLGVTTRAAATATCTGAAYAGAGWNTPSNADCFCSDNFLYSGPHFDVCSGECSKLGECGACSTVENLTMCNVLVGSNLGVISGESYPQRQAYAVDAFISSAYAAALSPAGWSFGGATYRISPDDACMVAFTSFFCLDAQVLAANGSASHRTPPHPTRLH